MKLECPAFLKSKGKAVHVTFNGSEVSDHESGSDEDGNFFTFTTTAVVNESDLVEEKPFDGELSRVLTYKKLITRYARLLQRMQ